MDQSNGRWLRLLWFGLLAVTVNANANDVLPRLFTNIPVNTNFMSLGYTYSEGNVSIDPSIALDVEGKLHTFTASYSRSFGMFGQSALFTAVVPYADLELTGIVEGQPATVNRAERSDPVFRLSMNLAGAPALEAKDFAGYRQKTIVGFNIEVRPPWGHYGNELLMNFGSNRWSISPELGISHRFKRFSLEAAGSLIFFSDNDEFLVDSTLKQETVVVARANLIYHFKRPGTFIGVGTLYLSGGETTVDGAHRQDLQKKSRLGAALSLPIGRRHNLLFKYSAGVTTRIGANFNNYGLIYTIRF